MPTNLPPDYYEIEMRFRTAESTSEKIGLLEQMYSVVPKHKGTDHLRADLRRQLSRLKDEAQQARRKHGGPIPAYHIEKEGAGQAVLVGAANTGKSALLRALTHAEPEVSEAPFTTWKPTPGMSTFENVHIQLVDTPPLEGEYIEAGLFDLIRHADLVLLLVDLQADPVEQLERTLAILGKHTIYPQSSSGLYGNQARQTFKPLFVLANKCDGSLLEEDCAVFRELVEELLAVPLEILPVSAETGLGFDTLNRRIFEYLNVIRVYARPPGKEPDLERPFVMKRGGTVEDLARKIHKDFYEHLKTARVWGSSAFDGQMVPRDYVLQDGDVVELKA